jgi:hypothetical protein
MRTSFLTFALLSAALAGCATAPRVHSVEPAPEPALRVWVGYPIGSGRVHPIFTNREAHVALFEIVPGRGVTMVYPFHQGDAIASDAHYADLSLQPGRMFYLSDPFGHASYQPRYYYAVASVAPLNLTRLRSSLGAMRRVLGPQMFASYRPYDVIDRLTSVVVPMQADEDWATDLFVDWPAPPVSLASTRIVHCANGRVFAVPRSYPYFACPGDAVRAVTVASAPEPPKEGTVEAPKAPRSGGKRDGVELSQPGADKLRRAEPGARLPTADTRARAPRDVVHYGGRESGGSPARSARGSRSGSSDPVKDARTSSARGASTEPNTPASRPARSSGESAGSSGKEKKPE